MVYLHGWADTGSSFQFVVDQFGDDWFVVAPDWRGFDESATEAPVCWFADYLADLDLLHFEQPAQLASAIERFFSASLTEILPE